MGGRHGKGRRAAGVKGKRIVDSDGAIKKRGRPAKARSEVEGVAKKRGRPAHSFPEGVADKVAALAQYGLTHEQISKIVEIPTRTLETRFAKELSRGNALALAAVGQTLYQKALSGDVACLIFLAKARMGMTEGKRQVDLVSSDKSMSPAAGRALTEGELERIERACDKFKWEEDGKSPLQ